jgi:uncharacterized protein DUF6093
MSVAGVLARGRAAAEALMLDACVIKRVTGTVTDQTSGQITPTEATIYTGKCRVQHALAQANAQDVGEAYLLILRLELQIPMSVTDVRPEDEVTITASVHDPDLVNRVFVVRDLFHKTHATARRLQVQERTS